MQKQKSNPLWIHCGRPGFTLVSKAQSDLKCNLLFPPVNGIGGGMVAYSRRLVLLTPHQCLGTQLNVYTTKEQGRTGRDLKLGGGELAKYHWIFSFGW